MNATFDLHMLSYFCHNNVRQLQHKKFSAGLRDYSSSGQVLCQPVSSESTYARVGRLTLHPALGHFSKRFNRQFARRSCGRSSLWVIECLPGDSKSFSFLPEQKFVLQHG